MELLGEEIVRGILQMHVVINQQLENFFKTTLEKIMIKELT